MGVFPKLRDSLPSKTKFLFHGTDRDIPPEKKASENR